MRIFLAGAWNAKGYLIDARTMCEQDGHEVVSTWLDEPVVDSSNPFMLKVMALNDWHDVKRADIFVVMREWPSTSGGFYVEMGIALEAGLPIVCIGKPNGGVYDALPDVTWYDDLPEFLMTIEDKGRVEKFEYDPWREASE